MRRSRTDTSFQENSLCSGHGNGTCEKKYEAKIVDGIVETGNLYTGIYDHPDLKRGLYRDMGPEFSFVSRDAMTV